MPIIKKPDYNIFASEAKTGEIVDFPNLLRGWGVTLDQTAGKPPMEWFNTLQKRTDEWLTYLSQRGLPEWQNTLDYPKDAVVQFGGKFYVAKKNTKNAQPDRSQNDWALFSDAIGVSGALQKTANLSDVADKSKARGNLGLGTAATKNVGTGREEIGINGTFGVGGDTPILPSANTLDVLKSKPTGKYAVNAPSSDMPSNSISYELDWSSTASDRYGVLIAKALVDKGNPNDKVYRKALRNGAWQDWVMFFDAANKPTATDVNAYTKQESDGRFVYKSGDTITALNVTKGLYVGEDTTVNRNLFVGGSGFVEKRGVGDVINNVRNTNGYRIFGAGDLFADIYHNERVGQNHFLGIHVANGGADGWFEFRNDGRFFASSNVYAGGDNGSRLHTDGNIWGNIWGGYLRDWLNNNTYGPQRPQPPVQVNTDAIGSLAFARLNPQNSRVGYGELVSGSNISPSGVTGYPAGGNWAALFAEGQLGGTWKCLGLCISDSEGGNRHYGVSLFVRVS
ncbi:hypothetical protein SME13J_02810 [Serratia marcescens]|nr:hypothetical protein SME13J_02810 [Serratia marcescens]